MPHHFDFDGLSQSLFVLQHTAYGSQAFCEKHRLNEDSVGGDYEWPDYKGNLKFFVSNAVIESAIKIRMLQDLMKHTEEEVDLSEIDKESREGLEIGEIIGLTKELTLRESCNKIIHATEASMAWVTSKNDPDILTWYGKYELAGEYRSKEWDVSLNIPDWCISMIRFNNLFQENVDVYRLYKYE